MSSKVCVELIAPNWKSLLLSSFIYYEHIIVGVPIQIRIQLTEHVGNESMSIWHPLVEAYFLSPISQILGIGVTTTTLQIESPLSANFVKKPMS